MKAAIFNPYLDTLGGGERYTMAFATFLREKGFNVDVQWKEKTILKKLEQKFGIDLNSINTVEDIKRGDGYDLIFWVSDGSIPLLRARHNFLHFQIPFSKVNGKSLLNRMKFIRIEKVICNSEFTKKVIDDEYGIKSLVIYPPVDVKKIKPKRKENLIISVGRFSQLTQAKRQDVLIDAFKMFYRKNKDWSLILAGGTEVGALGYVAKLKKTLGDYPVKISENPGFGEIAGLYGSAKIFWSACGYGIDELKNPDKVEHFGIAVVESMAAGCIPVVFNAGGHKETVENGKNGFLWNKKSELVKYTLELTGNPKSVKSTATEAEKRSGDFSYDAFTEKASELIS